MTDKERANEYVIKKHNIDMKHQAIDFCLDIEFSEDIADFLAGLIEGRKEKWHDLRKDSNDLPKHSGEYWCKWEDGTYCTEHYFGDSGFGSYVIAWCELPKLEE